MTPTPLSVAEIDRELASRTTELAQIAQTLVELDHHPGIALVRRYRPTGETARRWVPVEQALGALWDDVAILRSIVDEATAVRSRHGSRIDDATRARLTTLLIGQPHEIARTPIPLAQRGLVGPYETVVAIGIADLRVRMEQAFAVVGPFTDAVAEIHAKVIEASAQMQRDIERAGTPAAITDALASLLGRAGTDPLGFAPGELASSIESLRAAIEVEAARQREIAGVIAELRAGAPTLRADCARLAELQARADAAAREAEAKVRTAPLPAGGRAAAELLADVDALVSAAPASKIGDAVVKLRAQLAESIENATRRATLATGLLERREELRGRHRAYRAKAVRLGVIEDSDVTAADRIAAGLATRVPCDLALLTRAIADYRSIIGEKAGRQA
ncbi:hypothetical protein GCM10011591_04220 [Nocardia camponoti]|uniref:Uncharacterized protein n=1 Tax=Nocardia camponoti TaxID=1616106 RepID=A0A917Q8A8_9NOCA|nr:hypothetical protein GCM10011591_04220 [Nocardia camponoti]